MEKKRVRTLLRVSSRQQLHDDDIPIQRAEIEGFLAKHQDWEWNHEYMEKAVSAYKNSYEDRETLLQIIEDARNHEFDILLAYMSDRIGRREEYTFYISTLNSLGVEVWTVKDGKLKSEEHIDKLLNYIRFWQNEGESKKTSMRVKDAQMEMIKSGKFVGGKAPYGYRLVDSGMVSGHGRMLKKLEMVESQAEVVRKIFRLYIQKGYGYEKIAKELNAERIPAVATERWKGGTVCSILKNPIYMGYYAIHRREKGKNFKRLDRREWILSEVQNQDIVIVSPSEWEKAQEIRESRKGRIEESKKESLRLYEEQYSAPFSSKGKLALLGLAYCGYCGKRLKNSGYHNHWQTKDGTEKVSYVGRYSCQEKCKERSYYSQEYLESLVFGVVENYLGRLKEINLSEELLKIQEQQKAGILKEERAIAREIQKLTEDIKTLEGKLPEAIRGDYCFSADDLSRMIRERESQRKSLEQDRQKMQEKARQSELAYGDIEKFANAAPDWKQVFGEADTPTKKMLLSSLIERVDVREDDISIKFRIRIDDFLMNGEEEKVHETDGSPTTPYTPGSAQRT